MLILRKILYLFIILTLVYDSSASEGYARNWRKSLNLGIVDYPDINIDGWINSTKDYITEEFRDVRIQTVMKEDIKSCNIATAHFKLLYKVEGSDRLYVINLTASVPRVALSGQKLFKEEVLNPLEYGILSGRSFQFDLHSVVTRSKVENGIRSDYFKGRLNHILGGEVVLEGGHAEGYLILHLVQDFPRMLEYCSSLHPLKNITIIGTILTISSLKDPCQKSCFPMLNVFNRRLPILLTQVLPPNVRLAHQLESLVLIGGRLNFRENVRGSDKNSRDEYGAESISHAFHEKIVINFEHPQVRVFSATFDDIQ
jgi:hypothetical protein